MVSVIIPSYNHSQYISEAIESVLCQTYKKFELIIVDDGSTDNSREIIRGFDDSRIRFIEQENRGAHAAINRGMTEARGEFITILNSDDVYDPARLEVCVEVLEKEPEVLMVSSYIELIDKSGQRIALKDAWNNLEPWSIPDKSSSFVHSDHYYLKLICGNFIATTSNMFFRRSILDSVGVMRNLRFVHDWDFALRVSLLGKCRMFESYLLKYRIHRSNTISSNRSWLNVENAWIWATYLPMVFAKSGELDGQSRGNKMVEQYSASANFLGLESLVLLIHSLQSYYSNPYILDSPEVVDFLRKKVDQLSADDAKEGSSVFHLMKKIVKRWI